jgi:hypothetical protein
MLSLLSPAPMSLKTPAELLPSGWTSTDLWIAPLATALFATLTHAQPFFTALHAALFSFFSPVGLANVSYVGAQGKGKLVAVDPDAARGVCVLLLAACFVKRAITTFGGPNNSGESNTEDERARMRQRQLTARVAGECRFLAHFDGFLLKDYCCVQGVASRRRRSEQML